MDILLQGTAFVYLSLITFVFLRKPKINKIENFVYKGIIIFNYIEIIFDIAFRISHYYMPESIWTTVLAKLFICAFISWCFGYSSYIFVLSSPKNNGEEITKEIKQYFISRFMIVILFIIIADITVFIMPLRINEYYDSLILNGGALHFMYAATATSSIINVFTMIRNRQSIKEKKFTSVWILSILLVIGFIIEVIFPYISLSATVATVVTILIYFRLENPDLELINDLNLATHQAESANHAKTDFLSSMSHEIRTPLNAIIGFSKALAKEDISGTAKEEVTDILNASNNLLEIVNGILDISKIEANKIEIVNVDYSVREMINELINTTNTRIGSKQIELRVELNQNVPPVLYGDCNRIKQILLNILTNSVKYTKEGYILFQINSEPQVDQLKLIFSVEDSGIGMTEEDQSNLYNKFQRFDMEKNVNIAGTGLGMAITKGLVDLMGGTISAKSTYGEGTTFTVTINQQVSTKRLEDVEKHDELSKIVPFDATGQKVLVVDDNKINLKVAEKLLSEYNLDIELVDNGQECIERVHANRAYKIIFLDIMMPQMKGPEVVSRLKKIENFSIPVVALTADVISGLEEKYLEQGFDDCMSKPILEEDLYFMLKKYLEVKDEQNILEAQNPQLTITSSSYDINVLEKAGVNVKACLVQLKDIDTFNKKIEEFYDSLEKTVNLLFEYRNKKELEKYYACANELKNQSAQFGFNEFETILKEHELAAKERNIEFITNKYTKLKLESIKVNDVLKKYIGR